MLIGSDERGIILIIMSSICIPTNSMALPSHNFISKIKIDKEIEREEYNTLRKELVLHLCLANTAYTFKL